jgi:hypothetical protein
MGNDPEQSDRIREFVEHGRQPAKTAEYEVTGAWYYPEDGSGCVGSVIEELERLGCTARVHESAVEMDSVSEDDDLFERERA